jgi:predicted alpha/beta-hydrolase family hydrolase
VCLDAEAAVSARFEPARADRLGVLFVCAHGAGGHMDDASMSATSEALRRRGFDLVRFNFLYRERGSGRPDPIAQLMRCVEAVAAHAVRETAPRCLVLGGRSMGGRAASMLLAERGVACDGLLLLAYPLHPAGQTEKRRDAHLARIPVPVLCFNGTRDALCDRALMERAVKDLPRWRQHWVEGADHSFHVLKRSGRTDREVLDEIGAAAAAWVGTLPQSS